MYTDAPFFLLMAHHLFDLLCLELDRFIINENALPLVRLRHSPPPDFGGKGHDLLLVDTLEEDAGWLGRTGLHAEGEAHLDGVGETELEADELLAGVLFEGGTGLDCGSVTDTDEAEDGSVAF